MDLELFAEKPSIAVNYFPFHKDFDAINCLYCVVNAPYFFSPLFGYESEQKRHLYGMSKLYRELMCRRSHMNYFIDLSNYPFVRGENVYHTFRNFPDQRLTPDFIGNRINCFAGVSRAAMMLAIYMGFEHIYLVGFDYTHAPSRNHHYYEKGRGIFHTRKIHEKDFYEIAKEFIDITTITLDGASELLNSVTYKEYTGREPAYKENIDLVNEQHLNALATWPGYAIY